MIGGYSLKSVNKVKKISFVFLLLLLFCCAGSVKKVQAASGNRVRITFLHCNGKSSSYYDSIGQNVVKGTRVILPDALEVEGYRVLGWSCQPDAAYADYKVHSYLTPTENMTLYAVYRQISYKITFNNQDGTSSSAYYASLNTTAVRNQKIVLPEIPKIAGYDTVGWTTNKGGSSPIYKPGSTYTVQKNTAFYAVREKRITVTFYNNAGKKYGSYRIKYGSSVRMPGITNPYGYTFLGWSTARWRQTNPQYQVGEEVVFSNHVNLYPVLFRKANEVNLTQNQVAKLNTKKYTRLIFVGDSRTNHMKNTIAIQFGSSFDKNVSYVEKRGGMLSWFQETGYANLIRNLKKNGGGTAQRPVAVVFNLGVNDPANLYSYISFMKKIAPELKSYNCRLFFMSLNPINMKMIQAYGMVDRHRAESYIRFFNETMKNTLGNTYTYIDTYSELIRKGFGFNNKGIDDGLHYHSTTYKRIYNYAVRAVNRA